MKKKFLPELRPSLLSASEGMSLVFKSEKDKNIIRFIIHILICSFNNINVLAIFIRSYFCQHLIDNLYVTYILFRNKETVFSELKFCRVQSFVFFLW